VIKLLADLLVASSKIASVERPNSSFSRRKAGDERFVGFGRRGDFRPPLRAVGFVDRWRHQSKA
jgi:hypothetical protein